MLSKTYLLLISFFACLCYSCNSSNNVNEENNSPFPEYTITGTWKLASSFNMEESVDTSTDLLLQEAVQNEKSQRGRLFSFFDDGTFTQISLADPYIFGNYDRGNNELTLKYNNKKYKASYTLTTAGDLPELEVEGKDEVFRYTKYAHSLPNDKEDPYHPKNNEWRIKPSDKENAEQIKTRLTNYLGHLAYILKSTREREAQVVNFEHSMGPVQIYSGGIGVIPWDEVPKEWKNTYYNDDDAKAAYVVYEKAVLSTKYRGGSTGNWVEDDYNLLLAIYAKLKENEANEVVEKN